MLSVVTKALINSRARTLERNIRIRANDPGGGREKMARSRGDGKKEKDDGDRRTN